MARRNLIDIDNKIINAVIKIGAKDGARDVTAEKVAKMCDVSHFTCFEHFGTKKGMLDAAAQAFDRKYMAEMARLVAAGKDLNGIFNDMLDQFLADSDGALFYNSYTIDYGFDPTTRNARADEFLKYAKMIFHCLDWTDDHYLLAWDYLTSMAFYYAEKIIHGYLKNTPDVRNFITAIVLGGIENFK